MKKLGRILGVITVACSSAVFSFSASAENQTLRVMAFPGAFNWPLWAGIDQGFFDDEGVSVQLSYTSSSVQQFTEVMADNQDIIMTAVDNVVAYRDGFGEADLVEPSDVVAFMGGDNGFLRLVAQPNIKTYDDLVGTQLAVDAMTTGYAFVLRKFMQVGGVDESSIEYVSVGGALQRFQKMMGGKYSASVLMTPFDLMAAGKGFSILGRADETLGSYQGVIGAARTSWAQENGDTIVAFVRAYKRSLAWLYDRANKAQALEMLYKEFPKLPPEYGPDVYGVVLADQGGLEPTAKFDVEGLNTVLQLRKTFGPDGFEPGDLSRYYVSTFYEQASQASVE